MKNIKVIGMILTIILTIGMVTACSNEEAGNTAEETSSAPEATETVEVVEEIEAPETVEVVENAYSFEISTAAGDVSLEEAPMAVAIYDSSVLAIIDMLGYGENVVAVSSKNRLSEELSEYTSDFYLELESEEDDVTIPLVEANPDLIIASERQSQNFEVMSDVAPIIMLSTDEDLLGSLETNMQIIIDLFGGDQLAEDYLSEIYEKVDIITANTSEKEYTIGFLETHHVLMEILALDEFVEDTLGMTVVFDSAEYLESVAVEGEEVMQHYTINAEYWLAKNPDIVIVSDSYALENPDMTRDEIIAEIADNNHFDVPADIQIELLDVDGTLVSSAAHTNDKIEIVSLGDKGTISYLNSLLDAIISTLDVE